MALEAIDELHGPHRHRRPARRGHARPLGARAGRAGARGGPRRPPRRPGRAGGRAGRRAVRAGRLARAWAHGDYNRTNVLLDRTAGSAASSTGPRPSPTGWSAPTRSRCCSSSGSSPARARPRAARVAGRPAPVAEVVARDAARGRGGPELDVRTMLLLSWLRHVGGNLADSTRYAANPVWMHRNVRTVLAGSGARRSWRRVRRARGPHLGAVRHRRARAGRAGRGRAATGPT